MTNTTDHSNILGNTVPTPGNQSFLINSEFYMRANKTNWASYQMGIVAPFQTVKNPAIKYGDTVSYKVGFAFFGNPNATSPEIPNVQFSLQSSN